MTADPTNGGTWSAPYYGVQHRGSKAPRVSVTDHGGQWATLHCWFPGCGFSPLESAHDSAADARTVGDAWLLSQRHA